MRPCRLIQYQNICSEYIINNCFNYKFVCYKFFIIIFFRDFVQITNKDQKRQYKSEFMKCHKEYKHLADIMDPVRDKFAKLKDRMLLFPKGSNEYKVHININ